MLKPILGTVDSALFGHRIIRTIDLLGQKSQERNKSEDHTFNYLANSYNECHCIIALSFITLAVMSNCDVAMK